MSCRKLCVSGVSVAGRKRCAKLERTKGAFFSGDPSLRFDAEKKNGVASLYYNANPDHAQNYALIVYLKKNR